VFFFAHPLATLLVARRRFGSGWQCFCATLDRQVFLGRLFRFFFCLFFHFPFWDLYAAFFRFGALQGWLLFPSPEFRIVFKQGRLPFLV